MKYSIPILFATLAASCCDKRPDPPASPLQAVQVEVECYHFRNEATFENAFAATLKLTKHDEFAGSVTWSGWHKAGDRVGWDFQDGRWTSTHVVWSPRLRRTTPVDFNAGVVVQKIDSKSSVSILDRNGRTRSVRVRFDMGPMPGDGGRLAIPELPELVAAPSTPERTSPDPAMAPALLAEANYDWGSRNPRVRRRAQETYLKLLREFPTSSIVEKHRAAILSRALESLDD